MSNRREFIARIASVAGVVATSRAFAGGARKKVRLTGLQRREDTIVRYDTVGDNWYMSWADDDRQYASLCDGFDPQDFSRGMYSTHLMSLDGEPPNFKLQAMPHFPGFVPSASDARYYPFATLALDGCLYQFNTYFHNAVKLVYSPDRGKTWFNQDGTTPVRWEAKSEQSPRNMLFFNEPRQTFTLLSALQMGRNYQHNKDGYVYLYAPNGVTDGDMNELVMFRVAKRNILKRTAYEFFAGLRADGRASWSRNIADRRPVHTFPRGWIGKGMYSWQPSVTYNAPLGLYMMTSWGWDYGDARQNGLPTSTKPSYLGFWSAPHPWGPWTQFHEETAWLPGGDAQARAYQPHIAPKWIAPDGRSFWLVWSDYQMRAGLEPYQAEFRKKFAVNAMGPEDWQRYAQALRSYMPNYTLNAQRIELQIHDPSR